MRALGLAVGAINITLAIGITLEGGPWGMALLNAAMGTILLSLWRKSS